jgi:alkylation response protein AidB-like acyl-CoA dehydrogenase
MNFDFSEESKLLREQARRFLTERCSPRIVRSVMEGAAPYDRDLWRAIGEMGWLGTTIPERYDGSELGYEALCVLAEELGRAIAPVPFSSTIFLAAELIMAAGSEEQKRRYLPRIARGELIATFALSEGAGEPNPSAIQTRLADNQLTGVKWPVIDVAAADIAVAAVRGSAGISLAVIDLRDDGIARTPLETVDPSRPAGKLDLQNAAAEPLGRSGEGWEIIRRVLDRAAVLTAFEQVGGASGCLEMATAYAKERYAFGRPIGSFQAIKHKLADVYTATELARSNAYYGAWALSAGTTDLALAAATARVSASDAFFTAAKENIQVHGGMGFTWDVDCHLYYRRAKLLALSLGSTRHWKDRMIAELETRNAA